MLTLLRGYVGEAAAPFIFLALFLVIGGGALWLTPRIARGLDERDRRHPGYFDGMLEEDPAAGKETKTEEKTTGDDKQAPGQE